MKKQPYFDISVGLSPNLVVWPGDAPVQLTKQASLASGDGFEMSRLALSTHAGTHVDPPLHFVPGGATVDQLDLRKCLGPVLIAALPGRTLIHKRDIASYDWSRFHRVLFKTKNSSFNWTGTFQRDFTSLSEDAAEFLLEKNVQLVGIDYLSIEAENNPDFPVHHKLLENGVIILEGITLSAVPPGVYDLVCLPLRVEKGDGAPARALLFPIQE
ncbi:MAG: cyclase family protein [Calditrichaeota bacterium]|nr:cyclase family protein [Calditrichota bacterium]